MMQRFFTIGYLAFGVFQMFAIVDGLQLLFNMGEPQTWISAVIVTYIPLMGSGLGVYGASQVWHWNLAFCIILFHWYLLFGIAVVVMERVRGAEPPAETKRPQH